MKNVLQKIAEKIALLLAVLIPPALLALGLVPIVCVIAYGCEQKPDTNVEQTPGVTIGRYSDFNQDSLARKSILADLDSLQKFVGDTGNNTGNTAGTAHHPRLDGDQACMIDMVNYKAKGVANWISQAEAQHQPVPITSGQADTLQMKVAERAARLVFSIPDEQLAIESPCEGLSYFTLMSGVYYGLQDAGVHATDAGFTDAELKSKIGYVVGLGLKSCMAEGPACGIPEQEGYAATADEFKLTQMELRLTNAQYQQFRDWGRAAPGAASSQRPIGEVRYAT